MTPNPLTVGTITVTIQGTGFISGALVYPSYGSTITISPNGSTLSDNGGVIIASI